MEGEEPPGTARALRYDTVHLAGPIHEIIPRRLGDAEQMAVVGIVVDVVVDVHPGNGRVVDVGGRSVAVDIVSWGGGGDVDSGGIIVVVVVFRATADMAHRSCGKGGIRAYCRIRHTLAYTHLRQEPFRAPRIPRMRDRNVRIDVAGFVLLLVRLQRPPEGGGSG